MGTAANILIENPQGIYYADVATALPTITGTLGSAITMTNWADIGFYQGEGNIKIAFSGNQRRVRPGGMEGDLKGFVTHKKAVIEFMGLEETIAALETALGGSTLASNEMPDGGDTELSYIALAIVTTNKVYHFKKVSAMVELEKEIKDSEEAMIPFKLETFVEEAATAGERQWNILERTGA